MKFKIDEPKDTFVTEGVGYDWDCRENATVSYQYLEPCKTYDEYVKEHLEAQKAKDNGEWTFEPKQYKYKTIDANDGTDC